MIPPRHESEVGAHVAGVREPRRRLDRQHEAQGGERADAVDLAQAGGHRILLVGQPHP